MNYVNHDKVSFQHFFCILVFKKIYLYICIYIYINKNNKEKLQEKVRKKINVFLKKKTGQNLVANS